MEHREQDREAGNLRPDIKFPSPNLHVSWTHRVQKLCGSPALKFELADVALQLIAPEPSNPQWPLHGLPWVNCAITQDVCKQENESINDYPGYR